MMITVEIEVNANIEKIWEYWTEPDHITQWNFASDDWCCPMAENDIRSGGHFNWRMEAKDKSMGFNFTGIYDTVIPHELITYKMDDGRAVEIKLSKIGDNTKVIESFEAEGSNADEQQRAGWYAILENFKKYVESQS